MTRDKYLTELGSYLIVLPIERRTKVLEFYNEHTAKLESEGKDLVETLGTPKELADNIIDMEATSPNTGKRRKREKKSHPFLMVFLSFILMIVLVLGGFTLFSKITGKIICWDKSSYRFCIIDINKHLILEKTKLDDFNSVDLKVSRASVNLIPSDDYYIEYDITADAKNPYSINNGQLIYNDKRTAYVHLGFYGSFSTKNEYINIYYPEGADISKLTADLDMGSMTIEGCTLTNADIDLDMGKLEIINSTLPKISADLDMGSLSIEGCYIGNASFDMDMGGMAIANTSISGGLDADLDMGGASLELNSLDINEKPIEYGFNLDADMGSITVDGEKQGNKYNSKGASMIKVSCDMGGISVKTEKQE